jgi:hypothetical protein
MRFVNRALGTAFAGALAARASVRGNSQDAHLQPCMHARTNARTLAPHTHRMLRISTVLVLHALQAHRSA